jgi:hypothetical protein
MAMTFPKTDMLKSLITHHIALIDRFNSDSFEEFALLFLRLDDIKDLEIKKSIQIVFRDSDVIFEYDQNYIILLPKTDWNGAVELLNGLQKFLNQKFEDAIITYPDDGEDATKLLSSFSNMVNKTYQIDLQL